MTNTGSIIKKIFSAAFLLFAAFCFSQFPRFPKFRHIGLDEGLPQSGVYNILQDRKGFIWMITGEGLCRYDGYKFYTYVNDKDDSTSLPAGTLTDMIEDDEGYLWIATRSTGVSRFDPSTGKCTHITFNPKDSSGLNSPNVRALCKDKYGTIYAGTSHGLSIIHPKNLSVKRFYFKPMSKDVAVDENAIWALLADGDQIWVGTYRSGGLHCFDSKTMQFKTYAQEGGNPNSLVSSYVVGLQKDKQNNLWIATRGGLSVLNSARNKFTNYQYNAQDPNSLVSNDLWSDLMVDKNDNVWIGSFADGFTHYSAADKKFTRVKHHPDINSSLSSNAVRCIFKDASGLVWIGTANGLNIYDPRHEGFQLLQNIPGETNTLSGKQINNIMIDRKQRIWLAIAGEGVDVYDTRSGSVKHFKNDAKDPNSLPVNNVRAFAADKDGQVYVIAFGCPAVARYDEATGHFKSLGGCWANAAGTDYRGKVWVCTTTGLGPVDSLDLFVTNHKDSTTIGGGLINFVSVQDKDHLWVGAGATLNYFNLNTYKSRRYKFYDHIFCAFTDSKKRYWFGTVGGLVQFDLDSGKQSRAITTRQGLPNNVISAIEEDSNGNLWLATNKGLCCYHPEKGVQAVYDVSDGIPNNEFNGGSVKDNGRLYFSSMNGLLSFVPEKVKRNTFKAPITLTMLTVLNAPYPVETKGNETPSVTLTHDQYFFTLEFALLDYSFPQKNKFAYKLEGFNENWVNIGNKHEVTFTNLNPGDYTLLIKGGNNHGVWNEDGFRMSITVLPPWWKTKWFYILVGLSLVTLVYLYIKWRERKLTAEKKRLEDKVKERTAEVVQQKEIIEEKHKEITDSINYAQRIQRSLLASEQVLNANLHNYFIVFLPKDVVSGDFYQAGKLHNGDFAVLTADSTGHGVPGAIMSMLNISCFEKATEAEKIVEPSEILNHTRKRIIETLAKDGSAEGGKDGMDCSLLVFNSNMSQLKFAAANNNIWLLRNKALLEYNGDKMPVGKHDKQNVPFTQQSIQLQRGDLIFTFTDGYADQFGGPKNKKYKYKRLQEKLIAASDLSMPDQKEFLLNELREWQGEREQVDDILLIGIKV